MTDDEGPRNPLYDSSLIARCVVCGIVDTIYYERAMTVIDIVTMKRQNGEWEEYDVDNEDSDTTDVGDGEFKCRCGRFVTFEKQDEPDSAIEFRNDYKEDGGRHVVVVHARKEKKRYRFEWYESCDTSVIILDHLSEKYLFQGPWDEALELLPWLKDLLPSLKQKKVEEPNEAAGLGALFG